MSRVVTHDHRMHVLGPPTRPMFDDEAACSDTHPGKEPRVTYHEDIVRVEEGDRYWDHCLNCGFTTRKKRLVAT